MTNIAGRKYALHDDHPVGSNGDISTPYTGSIQGAALTQVAGFYIPSRMILVGDLLRFDATGDVLNNSGVTVNFVWELFIGATPVMISPSLAIGSTATRDPFKVTAEIQVEAAASHRVDATFRIGVGAQTWPLDIYTIGLVGVQTNATETLSAAVANTVALKVQTSSVSVACQVRRFRSRLHRTPIL